jgi:hypothetical protein
MGVGGIRGGGKRGGAGGARGPSGPSGAGKAGGAGFDGKVDRSESLVGPSGAAGGSNVSALDPVTAKALEIAKMLKSGQISSRDEATKKLVADILKEKLRMQSKMLTQRIADALQDDPRLSQKLDHLWSEPEEG